MDKGFAVKKVNVNTSCLQCQTVGTQYEERVHSVQTSRTQYKETVHSIKQCKRNY